MSIQFINKGKKVSGTVNITQNGLHDVADYATANVNVPNIPDLNIFTGTSEPTKKKGIWLNKVLQYSNVINEKNLYLTPVWNNEKMSNMVQPTWSNDNTSINTDGKNLFFMGGNSSSYKLFYKYDFINNSYTQLANLPNNLNKYERVSVANSEKIYYLARNTSPRGQALITYDIENNSFDSSAPLVVTGTFITGYCLVLYNNYLFIIGGNDIYNNISSYKKRNYKFNLSLQTGVEMANIPYNFNQGCAVLIGDYIYLIGGSESLRKVYKYSIFDNSYTELTDLTFDFSNGTITAVENDIYLFSNSKYYKYNVETGVTTSLGDMPSTFSNYYGNLSVFFNNSIYIMSVNSTSGQRYINILDFPPKNFTPNSIILSQNWNKFKTELIDTNVENGLQYSFDNVYYSDENGELDDTIEIYYGNGTTWQKFKN